MQHHLLSIRIEMCKDPGPDGLSNLLLVHGPTLMWWVIGWVRGLYLSCPCVGPLWSCCNLFHNRRQTFVSARLGQWVGMHLWLMQIPYHDSISCSVTFTVGFQCINHKAPLYGASSSGGGHIGLHQDCNCWMNAAEGGHHFHVFKVWLSHVPH